MPMVDFGVGMLTTKVGGGQDLMFSRTPTWLLIQKMRDGYILILMLTIFEPLNFHLKNGVSDEPIQES